jgi:hypothetical protein
MAIQQGIQPLVLTAQDIPVLEALSVSDDVKAMISSELSQGEMVVMPNQAIDVDGKQRIGWYEISESTGATIGVIDDGSHGLFGDNAPLYIKLYPVISFGEGLVIGLGTGLFLHFLKQFIIGTSSLLPGPVSAIGKQYAGKIRALVACITLFNYVQKYASQTYRNYYFIAGLSIGLAVSRNLLFIDPPVPSLILGTTGSALPPSSVDTSDVSAGSSGVDGKLLGSVSDSYAQASGQIQSSWSSPADVTSLLVQSLDASNATVKDATGATVGAGSVTQSKAQSITASLAGAVT